MAKKQYNIVEVMWVDAEEHGEIGWNSTKEQLAYAKRPCPVMRTVGFEVYRDDDHIATLSSIGDKECSSIEKIPMAFIKSINILKQPGKPGDLIKAIHTRKNKKKL